MELNTYLSFDGQCEEALKFYEECLGGKIVGIFRYEGSPMESEVPPEWRQRVMHATFRVEGQSLMAADSPPGHYMKPQGFSMSIQTADVSEAERIFQALSGGGTVLMPLQQTFWAKRFGLVVDRFGTPWMVNCEDAA